MNIGTIVGRKSHDCDVFFRIDGVDESGRYMLTGVKYRLKINVEREDLIPIRLDVLKRFRLGFLSEADARIKKIKENRVYNQKHKPGKVLHIDADDSYKDLCSEYYDKLKVPAHSIIVPEKLQPDMITDLLKTYFPDILIITGHDSLSSRKNLYDMDSYRSSRYFVDAVRTARCFNPSKDSLIIIAGACQSNYEALIDAGANIASSPDRILIHALDPVFAAEIIANTSIDTVLSMESILENTITGRKGLGGYQTRGVMREGMVFLNS